MLHILRHWTLFICQSMLDIIQGGYLRHARQALFGYMYLELSKYGTQRVSAYSSVSVATSRSTLAPGTL